MRPHLTTLFAAFVLVGCAAAPIERTGPDEWVIGEAKRDAWRTDSSLRSNHYRRSLQQCSGRRAIQFEPAPPDGRYHFRCVEPEVPALASATDLAAGFDAWTRCLILAEPSVDDLMSDANTVASTLATRCQVEFKAYIDLQLTGRDRFTQQTIYSAQPIASHQVARDVVLRVRAQRLNPKATPPPIATPQLTSNV